MKHDADAYPVPIPGLDAKLILTYDNCEMTDGVGAQLQRIYGTYAISRLLGATYLHSPLSRVDFQGLAALESNVGDPGFHHQFNDLFQINSDVVPAGDLYEVKLRDISLDTVHQLVANFDMNGTGGQPSLVRLMVPYGIADRFPDCYEVCKEISPFAATTTIGRALRVAIHVRRGDLFAVASHRMLPNSYYIQVAAGVARTLDALNVNFQIELYTEVPDEAFVVQPHHHGIFNRISSPVVLHPEMNRLDEFAILPNLIHRMNGRAIDAIAGLATADVIVMSRSSFSVLGAILNRKGIVLYHPFWHPALSSWITVDPQGHFDTSEFSAAVQRLNPTSR